jgi:hypothetical protein
MKRHGRLDVVRWDLQISIRLIPADTTRGQEELNGMEATQKIRTPTTVRTRVGSGDGSLQVR